MAERTERVYDFAMDLPVPNVLSRVKSSISWGPVVGMWAMFFTMIEIITLWICELLLLPEKDIDILRGFDAKMY